MRVSENVRVLSEALIQIEELIAEMGGEIGPEMEVNQSAHPGLVLVKPTLYFDLEKLNGYAAQFPRQESGTG